MTRLFDLVVQGGSVMVPIVGLSVATIACVLERSGFWYRLLKTEDKIVHDVLDAAHHDLNEAAAIAALSRQTPIGRFLLAPLQLRYPSPETFRLALEAAGEKEFIQMRKGDKLLETVVALGPLLGLLGTVTGLIRTFANLNIGGGGTGAGTAEAAAGIGEALISTASGMIVAIMALAFFRIQVTLQANQIDYFTAVGNELELIYRQEWYEPMTNHGVQSAQAARSLLSSER
jgi:biopolymer transport protein ExbB